MTGASSGIGLELGRQAATNGFDLIVTAQDEALTTAARKLEGLGGASVEAVRVDLAANDGVDELWTRVQASGRPLAAAAHRAPRTVSGR